MSARFMQFLSLGHNRGADRLYMEGGRLARLSFPSGARFDVTSCGHRLTLTAAQHGRRVVSHKRAAGGLRPVIDLNSHLSLSPLNGFDAVRIMSSIGRIDITPSVRAFHIARAKAAKPPFKVVGFFVGGGMDCSAFAKDDRFVIKAGVEVNPDFLDVWEQRHPEAIAINGDIRALSVSDIPGDVDLVMAGIPCTSHSNQGRAKKGLAGRPELGDTGDLFIPLLSFVAAKMPKAVMLENVPLYGSSLAGALVVSHLKKLGYEVFETILEPHKEWGEICDRRRWVAIATIRPGFTLQSPQVAFTGTAESFLDPVDDEQDAADCARIAVSIEGLRRHNARHKEQGHGFQFTTINRQSTRIPVIVGSYHKINMGPFVECTSGLRLLRQSELARIHGATLPTDHFATACHIFGQGVLAGLWESIAKQLGDHLEGADVVPRPVGELALA